MNRNHRSRGEHGRICAAGARSRDARAAARLAMEELLALSVGFGLRVFSELFACFPS